MIEFDGVTIRLGSADVVRGLSVRCAPGELLVVPGLTALARVAVVAAVSGIQPHDGAIRLDGVRSGAFATYVVYSDAAVDPFADGYSNVRMLAGGRVRRSRIEALADRHLDRASLSAPGGDLGPSERRWLHLVAAVASGAENIVIDDGRSGLDRTELASFLRKSGCAAAVILLASGPNVSDSLAASAGGSVWA